MEKIKAWIVIDLEDESFSRVFFLKKDAIEERSDWENMDVNCKVLPCIVSYSLPKVANKRK